MKLLFGILYILIFGACTTFNSNESGVRKACKSGVEEYDDGSTSFKCKKDSDTGESDRAARQRSRFDRITK